MLLSDGILKYEEYIDFRNLSKNTINGYKKELSYLEAYLKIQKNKSIYIDKISHGDLESYIRYKKEKGSELVSINRSISIINGFFNYLVDRKLVKDNPSRALLTYRIKNRPEREVLTEGEIKILIDNISNPTIKFAVITLANTGLRISELRNLKIKDVDFRNSLIKVINGKGGRNRVIPINSYLYDSMEKYQKEIRPDVDSDYFFATEKTGRISRQWINKNIKIAIDQLNWTLDITSHNLRHSFATNLINNNANLVAVQKLLGHKDLRTTSIYLHQSIDELHEAVNLLGR